LVVKVRGGEQWAAKRALHADIKKTLDMEGIDLSPLNRMVLDGIQGVRTPTRRPATHHTPANEQLSDDVSGDE